MSTSHAAAVHAQRRRCERDERKRLSAHVSADTRDSAQEGRTSIRARSPGPAPPQKLRCELSHAPVLRGRSFGRLLLCCWLVADSCGVRLRAARALLTARDRRAVVAVDIAVRSGGAAPRVSGVRDRESQVRAGAST
jgi:hypothetical protein